MTTHTDPHYWLAFWVILAAFTVVATLMLASNGFISLRAWIDRRNAEQDEITAADFGEASRAQIEANWEDVCWPFEDAAFVDRRVAA